jgi:hypothetical protein
LKVSLSFIPAPGSPHPPRPSLPHIAQDGPHPRSIFLTHLLTLSLSTSSLVAIPTPTAGVISEPSVSSSRPGSVPSSSLYGFFRSSLAHAQHVIANASSQTHRHTMAALDPTDKDTIEISERQYPQWEQDRARRRRLKRDQASKHPRLSPERQGPLSPARLTPFLDQPLPTLYIPLHPPPLPTLPTRLIRVSIEKLHRISEAGVSILCAEHSTGLRRMIPIQHRMSSMNSTSRDSEAREGGTYIEGREEPKEPEQGEKEAEKKP